MVIVDKIIYHLSITNYHCLYFC